MTRSFTEINSAIAWQLNQSIGEDRFEMWFSDSNAIAVRDGSVVISAVDEFSLAFIRKQFEPAVRDSITAVLGAETNVQFAVMNEAAEGLAQQSLFSDSELGAAHKDGELPRINSSKNSSKQTGKTNRANRESTDRRQRQRSAESDGQQLSFMGSSSPPPNVVNERESNHSLVRPTLKAYQFGTDNRLLQVAVGELLEEPNKFNPLYLHGEPGCGKSHLSQGIVSAARETSRYRRCLSITSEQFTSSFIGALQAKQLTGFRARFRNLDLLAVDDLQFFAGKQATIIEFQNTVETLLRQGKQMVLTADRPLQDLHPSCEQLITRIACGLALPVAYPDMEGRMAIIKQLASHRNIQIGDEVVRMVAERIGRDVRQLSGAVNRLRAASIALKQPVDLAMTTELLGDLFHWQTPVLSLSRIEKVVCDMCGVEADELRSKKRIKRISTARMLAMWLSRKHTSAGLSEIGKYYGDRSHSTVSAAEKKINDLLGAEASIELKSQQTSVAAAVGRLQSSLRVG